MVQVSRALFSLSVLAVTLSIPLKRTVAQDESDIEAIGSDVDTLDTAISGFPASGLVGALEIDLDANNLASAITAATSELTSTGVVDEADGTNILNDVAAFIPTIEDALTKLVADKTAAGELPIPGVPTLIESELQKLQTDTEAFGDALEAVMPAALQASATAVVNEVLGALATAVAAYN
ncbi:Hydrophobic surface binding protein [Mycena venus]|uniref:Hydrophobic surface binding protein n=1 Tax=Mycena venus TaxID=2733690 RepID=A0A8H6X2J9_9AGAR|nr:Hydrophobic surface binding protein [Mycena venus]